MRRIILTLLTLLTLAVLIPSSAFARVSYLCAMDGQVRSACCCPTKAKSKDAVPATTLKSACCCEVSQIARPSQVSAIEHKADGLQPYVNIVVVAIAPSVIVPRIVSGILARHSFVPPDPDRFLFVRHCALLL